MTVGTLAQDAVGLHGAAQDDWELDQLVAIVGPWIAGQPVVEIGCDRGGTLWLWRQLGASVYAVTLQTRLDGQFEAHGAGVTIGDTRDPAVRAARESGLPPTGAAMVFVDGGHDYETAKSDIGWSLKMAPAGLVVVHDVNRNLRHPEIETYIAWAEYAETRPHIVIARGGDRSPGTGILFPRGT